MDCPEAIKTTLDVRLHRMTPADVDQVAAIDAETWPWPWPADEWRKQMTQPGHVFAVATFDTRQDGRGKIAGLMVYRVFDDFIHLYKIAVKPEHQGRGIGSAMLRRLKK